MFDRLRKSQETANMIRNAVDTCPDGICFGTHRGQPVLVNRQMNDLSFRLLGRGILNTEETWCQLQNIAIPDTNLPDSLQNARGIIFINDEGRIWQLERTRVNVATGYYIQYLASDISPLYEAQSKLARQIQTLWEQQNRQRLLLQEIVATNRTRELLDAKIQVHDDFGQCLIASRQLLDQEKGEKDLDSLLNRWKSCIDRMLLSDTEESQTLSPEDELCRAAEMIGCRIRITGDRPQEHKTQLLLYASVREALTNAVRHGQADCLDVRIRSDGRNYLITITDNGWKEPLTIHEGNGLGNLRRRLEEAGAIMEINSDNGVRLTLHLPGGENK